MAKGVKTWIVYYKLKHATYWKVTFIDLSAKIQNPNEAIKALRFIKPDWEIRKDIRKVDNGNN